MWVPLSSTVYFHSGSNELPFCLHLLLMFINNQNSGQDFYVSLIIMKLLLVKLIGALSLT